eukprot:4784721-Amphidinium_carterae.1
MVSLLKQKLQVVCGILSVHSPAWMCYQHVKHCKLRVTNQPSRRCPLSVSFAAVEVAGKGHHPNHPGVPHERPSHVHMYMPGGTLSMCLYTVMT